MTDKEPKCDLFDISMKGDEIQKLSVVENLPTLMNIDTFAAFNKIIPKIQQELPRSSTEFNITTSRIFQVLIESHFRTDVNITNIVLQGLDSKDPIVANAWLDTLLEVISILPIRLVQTEILPLAVQKGQCSQSTSSRVVSCKILGKVVLHQHMKPLEIQKGAIPVVLSLCQDVNYTVRAAICEQLPAVAKGLGAALIKNNLLPNLVELASDDNINVRATAVSSVVQVLTILDKDTKAGTMVNLIMNLYINQPKLEEASSVVLAKNMGLMLTALEGCLTSQQAEAMITFYQNLAKKGLDTKDLSVYSVDTSQDVKGREYCAQNFPQVMSFALVMSPGNVNKLYEIFKSLSYDSCFIVRHTIAGVFHDVARILGPKNSMMRAEFVRLLRDEAEEVLGMLVPHIGTTLILFLNHGTLSNDRSDNVSSEISKALLKCYTQLLKGYNWRLTTIFIRQLETLPMVFKSDQIHNEFTPPVVRCAVFGRAKPIRSQSVRTLLFFLRWNTKLIQRTWLRDHLIHELAENKCSYTRHIFIELCKHALELFSQKFFKENFFMPLLKLANDRVSTVRYATVNLLPRLRRMIHLPQDRKLLSNFESAIVFIEKNEKDRDVLANLIRKTKEMISPVFNSSNDESEQRERRLQEEEDNVAKGKIVFNVNTGFNKPQDGSRVKARGNATGTVNSQRSSRSQSANRDKTGSSSTSLRSTSVPRPANITSPHTTQVSDMTFLKQHFYIDAGVDLPIEKNTKDTDSSAIAIDKPVSIDNSEISVPDTEVSDNLSNLSLESDYSSDNSNLNMTDDVKVNMRKKKSDKTKRLSHSEIPTAIYSSNAKNKRHSSVYSDVSSTNRTANKRRSLNIQTKEMSKIPVILKSLENVHDSANKSEEKDAKKGASNLPVPVRSYQPPANRAKMNANRTITRK